MMEQEERRNDPVIRAEVKRVHKARQAMMLKAAGVLEGLWEEMRALDRHDDDSIYDRCTSAVLSAFVSVDRDADFMKKIGGETYVGNLAAGALGRSIEWDLKQEAK